MHMTRDISARAVSLAAVLLAGACASPPGTLADASRPDGSPIVPVEGGTLDTGCGYLVTTPRGVSQPVWGDDYVGEDPTPYQVHLGIARDPATSIVVSWRTHDDTTRSSLVEYGIGDERDRETNGMTFVYYPYGTGLVRIHEAHLCGLEPDATYSYRISGSDVVRSFRTAPGKDADVEIVVGVLGDTRDGWGVWQELLATMEAREPPDLLLFTGDAVDKAIDQNEWNRFFALGESVLSRVPMVFAIGNHENNDPLYFAQLALPGDEATYAIDYGPLHLIVLNDLPADVNAVTGAIADFFEADLNASSSRPWRIVAHHRPMWSAARLHGSAEELRAAWGSLIDGHAVPLVVNGHDHNYERTWPMRGEAPAEGGTTYVVSGGAGAELYESGVGDWTAVSESVHHSVTLRMRTGLLRLEAHRLDGSLLDQFAIRK
jgi:acid phosphatase type 7